MGVRWYVAYPLSTRHVEELMEERGVEVDHSTINRWVIKYSPQLEEAFHRRKRPVWVSWRMDETYIKVKGEWKYLYRAVDKHGQTIDFLLTEHRDKEAALRFLKKAIRRNGVPETITIDGSDANEAAIKSYNEEHGTAIIIRQVKYLNNIVEQDHRGVKRVTRPMLGFKSFDGSPRHAGRDRAHAHDQETAAGGRGGRRGPHCGRTVLLPGRLIPPPTGATAPSRPPEQNLRHSPLMSRSCTPILADNSSQHKNPLQCPPYTIHLRGHRHGTNPLFLRTRARCSGVGIPHALLAVAATTPPPVASRSLHLSHHDASAPTTQTVCGADAQAPLCPV